MITGTTEVGVIRRTKDYSIFRSFDANRKAELRKDLTRSIAVAGQITPIIVDAALHVIDGQHRLLACQSLGIPVNYIVSNLDESAITEVNSSQRAWTKNDYIDRHAAKGVPSFILLKELMAEHQIPASTAIVLLDDYAVKVNHGDSRKIKTGSFFIDEDALSRFRFRISFMKDFWSASGGSFAAKFKTHRMMYALVRLVAHPNYNHDLWLKRLNEQIVSSQIKVPANTSHCLELIEELYNFKLGKKNRVELT